MSHPEGQRSLTYCNSTRAWRDSNGCRLRRLAPELLLPLRQSEVIGTNRSQSEAIGLIRISSGKLRLVPIVLQRQVYVAKARTNKGEGAQRWGQMCAAVERLVRRSVGGGALRVGRSFVEKRG